MISCKEYVAIKKAELKEKIAEKKSKPCLAVITFDNDPSTNSYIKGIKKDCEEVGMILRVIKMPVDITNGEFQDALATLSCSVNVDGVLIQSPLPEHINKDEARNNVFYKADVDCFNKYSRTFEPCTPLGVINYLKYNNYNFEGKDICVVGRSEHVGKPLARMLTDLNATVTLCHSKTDKRSLKTYTNISDLIITCVDKIEFFDETYFGNLSSAIDIGLGENVNGKLRGNLDESAISYLTREDYNNNFVISGVGGVGLLTRLELLNNTYKAFCMQRKGE